MNPSISCPVMSLVYGYMDVSPKVIAVPKQASRAQRHDGGGGVSIRGPNDDVRV
jgi:hypothetical protein